MPWQAEGALRRIQGAELLPRVHKRQLEMTSLQECSPLLIRSHILCFSSTAGKDSGSKTELSQVCFVILIAGNTLTSW